MEDYECGFVPGWKIAIDYCEESMALGIDMAWRLMSMGLACVAFGAGVPLCHSCYHF